MRRGLIVAAVLCAGCGREKASAANDSAAGSNPAPRPSLLVYVSNEVSQDLSVIATDRDSVIDQLASDHIEARPVWKPMHLQPVFAGCRRIGGNVAESLFNDGICLPSGSSMTAAERDRVIASVRSTSRSLAREG